MCPTHKPASGLNKFHVFPLSLLSFSPDQVSPQESSHGSESSQQSQSCYESLCSVEPPQQQELQPQEERESGVVIATTAADTATENEGEDVANTAKQSLASCDWLH